MSGIVGANFTKDSGVVASHKFQRFTNSNGTDTTTSTAGTTVTEVWVKPSGITTVVIECIGAGGAGSGGTGGGSGRAAAGPMACPRRPSRGSAG